jgi:Protein of unknown function (DUF2442)
METYSWSAMKLMRQRSGLIAVAPPSRFAISARYDKGSDRVIFALNTGYDLTFSRRPAEGLQTAKPHELDPMEITPSGFGLHFPKIDADLRNLWLQAVGRCSVGGGSGRATSKAKAEAASRNGKLGGGPKKAKLGRT